MLKALQERLAESREAFSSVFTNPNLRRVELSWAGTVCAYWIFIVALSLYAYEQGGASAVGLVGLLRVLPSLIATPFGTLLGDRFPRERVIVAINVARSVTIAGAAVAAFAGAPAGVVYALAGLMGLLQSTFRPTQAALLPLLARSPEELTAANLVLTTIESVGVFAGPAIGGLLLAVTGTDTVFAITGVVFLLAALLLVGVRAGPARCADARRRRAPPAGVCGLRHRVARRAPSPDHRSLRNPDTRGRSTQRPDRRFGAPGARPGQVRHRLPELRRGHRRTDRRPRGTHSHRQAATGLGLRPGTGPRRPTARHPRARAAHRDGARSPRHRRPRHDGRGRGGADAPPACRAR